jgi:Holliday junction resolvase RusA-like endonuclease
MQLVAAAGRFDLPLEQGRFLFEIPMPKSWSQKRRQEFLGKPCLSKPDLDNLLKAVMDSLLPDGDCQVWHIASAEKRWAERGAVVISVASIKPEEP